FGRFSGLSLWNLSKKLVSLYGVVKFSSTVRFRLWHSAKWRGGKYGGVIPSSVEDTGLSG
ncbi:hypothetical protein, partial [Pseudomonas aeruginosa]|uniref:hypothetical protein n=1 Tax=Pseudomonas aeruginosa TaxID=287 RepID=UPI0031B71A3E